MYTFSHILLVILYFIAPVLSIKPGIAKDIEEAIKQERRERMVEPSNDLPYNGHRIIVQYVGNINQPKVSFANQLAIRESVDKSVLRGSPIIGVIAKANNKIDQKEFDDSIWSQVTDSLTTKCEPLCVITRKNPDQNPFRTVVIEYTGTSATKVYNIELFYCFGNNCHYVISDLKSITISIHGSATEIKIYNIGGEINIYLHD